MIIGGRTLFRRVVRPHFLAGLFCVIVAVSAPYTVRAQVPLLTAVSVTSSPRADILTVDFTGGSPAYQVIKRSDRLYELSFPGARAPKERAPAQGVHVRVSPSETALGLLLTVVADSPVSLRISRTASRFTFVFETFAADATVQRSLTQPRLNETESSTLVYLKYADPSEVLGMLGTDSAQTVDQSQMTQLVAQSPASLVPLGASSFPQQTGVTLPTLQSPSGASGAQRVNDHISINRRLNAVLLSGSHSEIEALQKRIALFDVPVASITLETKIVELTESAARNVGLSFASGGAVGSGGLQVQSFQKPTFEVQLQAQILAQIEQGGGRIIATPSIQALSGQSATILTGDALPVVTSITFPGSPPTIQQQIQYINVGVQLQILPRYSSDGYVTSRIVSQVSSVTAFLAGNIPQISQRLAMTQATVKDGNSYVIGGLVQEEEIRNLTKIPGLGDLPIFGGLFRSERSSRRKTSLYIVVTPHVRLPPSTDGLERDGRQ